MVAILRAGVIACALVSLLAGCGGGSEQKTGKTAKTTPTPNGDQSMTKLGIQEEQIGVWSESDESEPRKVTRYYLSNDNGMSVGLINYGAIVQSVMVPDKDGNIENVVLGFESLDGYTEPPPKNDPYFGAICGRFSNRIAKGKFSIEGTEYTLATNNEPNHLHGGNRGFNDVWWQAETLSDDLTDGESVGVKFTYVSPDGEEGYPGQLRSTVTYLLNNDNELRIAYEAQTDKATPVNLTNHAYWNLGGVQWTAPERSESILGHVLTLNCKEYLPVDDTLIPTGKKAAVAGTPMDFTKAKAIGKDFEAVKGDAKNGGYDHCFVIDGWQDPQREPLLAAKVEHPESGRSMEIHTNQPGIQFYTGNFLSGEPQDGAFPQHHGFCLECQQFPDAPNQPDFPEAVIQPGQVYRQITVHRFGF